MAANYSKEVNMTSGVIITLIICVTLIILAFGGKTK